MFSFLRGFLRGFFGLAIASFVLAAGEMREHMVYPDPDGLLNFPNPTQISYLRVSILLDNELADLDYSSVVNELLLAFHFFDPTFRLTVVLRANLDIRIAESRSGTRFVNMCDWLAQQENYADNVDLTIMFTPHMPVSPYTTLGWALYSSSCIALAARADYKPEVRTLVHEIGHAVRGLPHSVKPPFDCNRFTFPEHVDKCRTLSAKNVRHAMNAVVDGSAYDDVELAADLLSPSNVAYEAVKPRSQNLTMIRFTDNAFPPIKKHQLRRFCDHLPNEFFSNVTSCQQTKFSPLHDLPVSNISVSWSTDRCKIGGNRTHVCLSGFPFARARLARQSAYSMWSAWSAWKEITNINNTVPRSNLRVFRRHADCLSFDAAGSVLPNDTLLHKCPSIHKFQYLLKAAPQAPDEPAPDEVGCEHLPRSFNFVVENRQCWSYCRHSLMGGWFRPEKNGRACRPSPGHSSGFCLAGACVSLTSPSVQQLEPLPISTKWYNISASDFIRAVQRRGRFVKSLSYVLAGPTDDGLEDRAANCDVICIGRLLERLLQQPAAVFSSIEVSFYKQAHGLVRRLWERCEHVYGQFVRCANVCLIASASDNIRMISPIECAAFSMQIAAFFVRGPRE